MKDIATLGPLLSAALKAYGEGSERSVQSAEGRIGPSDLGFCRQKAALMTRGVEQSDSKSIAAAQIGTAIHVYAAEAFRAMFPGWVIDNKRVTARFPSGVEVSGTPDLIAPDFNALIDVKTVDGFEWVRRMGVSTNHKFQRHTYALGAIAAGLLDEDEPIYVGNLYIDRSGKEPEPLLVIEEMDWTLTAEIEDWISDVTYAVKNSEDASRDIAAPVCEKICEFFTVCRGGLPVSEGGESIDDEERIEALRMYVEARDLEKVSAQRKREAQARLVDTNGTANVDGKMFQIRWTSIGPSSVEAFEKAGYMRMDVRAVKTPR
jgi:hypothetical protein